MAQPQRSTRREFLVGKSAADALADAADAALGASPGSPPTPLPEPPASQYFMHFSRRAMACQFEVAVNAGQYDHAGEAALAVLDLIEKLEDQLTIFREHSEVSRLNRLAGQGPVAVEPRLFALLGQAVELYRRTGGAYDVTSAPLSEAWGFRRRAGAIPSPEALAEARSRVGSDGLVLDAAEHTVAFARQGIAIDLGSIGKGYALDRSAELLAADGIGDYLLHGGNSSVLARGREGSAEQAGWAIGLRNPLRPREQLGQIRLADRALSTSGSGTQYFTHKGRRYGHIMDPRSGWPAEGVLTATALAPTAAEAEALSTALYVLGPAAAEQYCREHPEVGAVLVCPATLAGAVEVHVLNLDASAWLPGD